MADHPQRKPDSTSPVAASSDTENSADVGRPYPDPVRDLAADHPEGDPVLKAYKDGFLADSTQQEARAKARVVDESPRAHQTPSGTAVKQVAGIGNDAERGEAYARERGKVRWGYQPPGS